MLSSTISDARRTASVSIIIAANTACSASSEYGGRRAPYGSRSGGPAFSGSNPGAIEDATRVLDIFPGRTFPGRVPEERGRMIGGDEGDTVIPVYRTAQLPDRLGGLQKGLCRECPERQDHAGPNE